MTSKLSQLLQNLLTAPNLDVADPEALTKQAQAAFNKGVVEAIENMDQDIGDLSRRLATINGAAADDAGNDAPALQTSAAIPGDPVPLAAEAEGAAETATGYGEPAASPAGDTTAE